MERSPSAEEFARTLTAFIWAMARRLRQEGAALEGLSLAQMSVLSYLARSPGQTNADLARDEQITPQSMSSIVHELIVSEFVSRKNDEKDGRLKRLYLTPKGTQALKSARERRTEWLAKNIDGSFSPQQQAALLKAVEELSVLTQF